MEGTIMSLMENQNLVIATGGIQQKNVQAGQERLVSGSSAGLKVNRVEQNSSKLALEETTVTDTASISRPGIIALESAQNVSDESVIRDKDTAGLALADSTSQMLEQPERALQAQANQTPQQVLALLTGN
jgi:poly-gamma-glutamate capsule biosynthesis protein CapA/YwtB (metallophosphatase superfamily)